MKPPPGPSWLNPKTGRYEANGCYWTGDDWKQVESLAEDDLDGEPTSEGTRRSPLLPGVGVEPPPGSHQLDPETNRYEANGCYWTGSDWIRIDESTAPVVGSDVSNWSNRWLVTGAAVSVIGLVIGVGLLSGRSETDTARGETSPTTSTLTTTTNVIDEARMSELNATVDAAISSRALAAEAARVTSAAEVSAAALEENRRAMERQQAAADAAASMFDRGTYSVITERDYGLLLRDPRVAKGRRLVVHGYVTQLDSVMGSTSFRADTAATLGANSYDFDTNTIVNFDPVNARSQFIEKDIVTLYAEVVGTTTYDSPLGVQTVPVLKANIIDIVG